MLWGDGAQTHGIGVQSGRLQIYANQPLDFISFGTGRSEAFNERMRIINSGADALQLNGGIILRNGTNSLDRGAGAGIWLNRSDNTGLLAFIGTQNK